ncbi:MAG: tyrosine-type recombinase/integrase [Candidatus Neomarinimicrobiota bacterium]|mgnify:CR=1 FL=1
MLKNKEKEILKNLRLETKKEVVKKNLMAPLFSIQCDHRTKKLKLNYSYPKYIGVNNDKEKIFKKQQKDYYLKNITLSQKKEFLTNLPNYIRIMKNKIEEDSKNSFINDGQSIIYWTSKYINISNRSISKSIKESSIKGDKESLESLINYCKIYHPQMLDIWEWPKKGKDFIIDYMKFKQLKSSHNKKPWSDGTVNSNYQRIRAFFNWISYNYSTFPANSISGLVFKKNKGSVPILKENELESIKKFIDSHDKDNNWKWFIEMLIIFLETGLKLEMLCSLKLKDLNIKDQTLLYNFNKKNRNATEEYKLSEYSWGLISHLIFNKNNSLRNDKIFLFHQRFYRNTLNKGSENELKLIENPEKPFSVNGFRKKFSDMIVILGLNKRITPQYYRNYFILKMLGHTNNNINLVSKKMGLSNQTILNNFINNFEIKIKDENLDLFKNKTLKPKPKRKRLKGGGVSVPFMITREMFRELVSMGYSKNEISKMKSEEAHELILKEL